MEELEDWKSYYEECARLERRNMAKARFKLLLLWLPARFGLPWARRAVDEQQWRYDSSRYGLEEVGNCLYKCEKYGTPWHFIKAVFRRRDEDSGYDGFLAKEDQFTPQ
jgi:hypothetical protein